MDYVVGSVAALISGDVTPNRPKLVKRALTPIKHQPSPNVTPKSELVGDRSIFLSPTLQKKKAIIKKSPKRIFQNPDLDVTNESENNFDISKAKVKKHLRDNLDDDLADNTVKNRNSPKSKVNKSAELYLHKKKFKNGDIEEKITDIVQSNNENTPKKNKKGKKSVTDAVLVPTDKGNTNTGHVESEVVTNFEQTAKSPKKRKRNKKSTSKIDNNQRTENTNINNDKTREEYDTNIDTVEDEVGEKSDNLESPKKKKKNKKKKSKKRNKQTENVETNETLDRNVESTVNKEDIEVKVPKKKKKKNTVNPNAITNKDTDSEHESDNEIESETEQHNNEILDTGPVEESSEEDEIEERKKQEKKVKVTKAEYKEDKDEVMRTLFVGNVPFNPKCKKEIKRIFNKYGDIETIRIRTVPVKDATVTPKLAVIKNELHPDRSTVNVYIKYKDQSSVEQALVENNTILNEHHLRVSKSTSTGSEHDPKCSVFVGNMPFALEDDDFRAKFEKCGEIVSVRIIRDRKTNAGKGFGYVNFASKDGVELALSLSDEDLTIKNRILRVKRCTPGSAQVKHQGKQRHGAKHQMGRNFGGRNNNQRDGANEGANRRIMNKRRHQEREDGPPNKRQRDFSQPKEKKARKEFVGMTAEKKKKHKFNKGQKKKKALSEILSK